MAALAIVSVEAMCAPTEEFHRDTGGAVQADAGAGGSPGSGGAVAGSGGKAGSGGLVGSGGKAGSGGLAGSGGKAGSGGSGSGGLVGSGGKAGSGGLVGSGGKTGSGGSGSGGLVGSGGVTGSGGSGSGGLAGSGGAATGSGGLSGAGGTTGAGIAYDSSASRSTCSAGANTITHVLGAAAGTGRIVLVGAVLRGSPNELTSVTYDGVAMTKLAALAFGEGQTTLYYILDASLPAAAGSYTVVANGPSQTWNCDIGVSSFTGVVQSPPGSTTYSGAGSATFSKTLAAPISGSWGFDVIGWSQNSATATAGQTTVWSKADSNIKGAASYKACGADPCAMGWTTSSVNSFSWVMTVLPPM